MVEAAILIPILFLTIALVIRAALGIMEQTQLICGGHREEVLRSLSSEGAAFLRAENLLRTAWIAGRWGSA